MQGTKGQLWHLGGGGLWPLWPPLDPPMADLAEIWSYFFLA